MRKFIKFLLPLAIFVLILSGCGSSDDEESNENTDDEADTSEVEEENDDDELAKQKEKDEKEKQEKREKEEKEAQQQEEDKDSKFNKSTVDDITKNDGSKASKEDKDFNELEATDDDLEIVQEDDETKDEDLKLKEIYGTASVGNDGFEYDQENGYHVVRLQAGLSNYSGSQGFKDKWVAFALPDGVSVPDVDEVPSGVVIVSLPDGHTGVAVKIPNLDGIDSETVFIDLPLIGEPDDNDPNENLYLYNADGNKHSSQLIGEINSTRSIDFTELEDK